MNIISQDSIRDRLRSLSITQQELSRKSGVSQPSISKFLGGKSITVTTLEKLWPFLYGDASPSSPNPGDQE